MIKYIVEFPFGENWWLADWEGDPGRTIVRDHAKLFNSERTAKAAIKRTIKRYPDRGSCAFLRPVKIRLKVVDL
jgi:hypothetical protein